MSVARVILRLQRVGALPADDVMNVLHFKGGTTETAVTVPDAQALADGVLTAFVNNSPADSTLLSGTANAETYSLHDTPPRVPIAQSSTTSFPHTDAPLPAELAICASFQAAPISGVNQARRRGRIYLGPVGVGTMESSGITSDVNVVGGARVSAKLLLQDLGSITGVDITPWRLAVYSPTADAGGATPNDATVIATQGWVDDAFDIQRRRGASPQARDTFTIP